MNHIYETKGVHCAGISLLCFEQFSPAVVFGRAQYELFSPRGMLLWRFSMLLFVYKHKNRASLKTVLCHTCMQNSLSELNNGARNVIGREAYDIRN